MRDYSRGREKRDLGAPQGQGWNALAGAGHRAQHIWRLEVTSSPCRHPSAHVLKCVSFTKYSVCWGPVNAWLFLASARWRTLLAGSAKTHTYAYSYKPRCHTHTSAFILQETWSFRRIETELLLFGPFATPTNVENSNNHPLLLLCQNMCQSLACCVFLFAIWWLYYAGGMYDMYALQFTGCITPGRRLSIISISVETG